MSMTLRIDKKTISKTWRLKKNSGSPFKNWDVHTINGDGAAYMFRAPRGIWESLRVGAWYDLTMEKIRIKSITVSDWALSADINDYRKKIVLMENVGIARDVGAIILDYSFPQLANADHTNLTQDEPS